MKNFYIVNLQLLAATIQTTLLGTANADTSQWGGTGLSAENKTFYDKVLIREASANLVHDQFAQKRPIPKNGGKTIEFRKFAPLAKALTPLTEGVTPDGKSLTVQNITATVSQYGDFVPLSDVLELTAIDPIVVETTQLIGKQAGLTLDTVTRNVMHSGTNVTYCPKVAADGAETAVNSRTNLDATCQLTVKVLQQVVAKLRAQNAPTINGKYVGIIHPYVAYSLMRDHEWIDAHKYSRPENLFTNEIGEVAGIRFVESSEAKVYANSVFGTLVFGSGAYATTEIEGGGLETIIKQKGSAGTADPLNQRSTVGWKAIKTAELLIPNYLVRIESKVADFASVAEN